MDDSVFVIALLGICLGALTIFGLPWMILHHIVQWRRAGQLSAEDEHMLEDVWRAARAMERRIDALESILDAEAPGWRKHEEDR